MRSHAADPVRHSTVHVLESMRWRRAWHGGAFALTALPLGSNVRGGKRASQGLQPRTWPLRKLTS